MGAEISYGNDGSSRGVFGQRFAGSPARQVELLIDTVEDLVAGSTLNRGQGNRLTSKLNAALRELDRGNDDAINQLMAFINQVNDFISMGTVTSGEGEPLIDAANAIINFILNG